MKYIGICQGWTSRLGPAFHGLYYFLLCHTVGNLLLSCECEVYGWQGVKLGPAYLRFGGRRVAADAPLGRSKRVRRFVLSILLRESCSVAVQFMTRHISHHHR